MSVFKFTFVNNSPISCTEVFDRQLEGTYYLQQHNGYIIYIIVEASTKEEAKKLVGEITKKFLAS